MNYRALLANQILVLEQKFKDQCVVAHSGGLFHITPELLNQLSNIKETSQWILDMNQNPIFIGAIANFYREAYNIYYTALKEFGEEFNNLKTQRSVNSLLDL